MANKKLGIGLIVLALIGGSYTLWRTYYISPENRDTGLPASTASLDEGEVVGNAATIKQGTVASPKPKTNTPTPAPTSKATSADTPTRLIIPKLGIDAKVLSMGVTSNGNMAAPPNFTDVAWYKYGAVPGTTGSAVMSGHEDNAISLDGVFKHLEDLSVGDDVYVVRGDGTKLHFQVYDEKTIAYNTTGPVLHNIFSRSDGTYLNLITCAGKWVQSIKTNDKRLVIYTKLVE